MSESLRGVLQALARVSTRPLPMWIAVSLVAATVGAAPSSFTVTALRTEYKENPLGIDALKPRLSWQLRSERRGAAQTAYELRVAQGESDLRAGRRLVWTSGRVSSDQSALVPYAGPLPTSGERYYWQVRVWDEGGDWVGAWSESLVTVQ